MAYEVTATRKRPQGFDELAGQEFVSATLKNTILSKHIAHAYLFSGPRGCGKTSTARILAKALNCEQGLGSEPCGVCDSCKAIVKGSSLDVIEIDGASNTSVENIRQIKDEVLFPPNSSRYKIYIIDEVHMLSNSAFNALLKTIEEPPPYIIFMFATTELHKVPATIKSRCQQFNFRLVEPEVVKKLLLSACEDLGIKADDDALLWIAREATGSVRDAYTLFDQIAAFASPHITMDKIKEKLGLVGLDDVNVLSETLVRQETENAFALLDTILTKGISVDQFVIDLVEYFRSILLIKQGVTKESILGYSKESFSSVVVDSLSISQVECTVSLLLDLYRDIRYCVSPRFELELAISKLCSITNYLSQTDIGREIVLFKKALVSGSAFAFSGSQTLSSDINGKLLQANAHDKNSEKKKYLAKSSSIEDSDTLEGTDFSDEDEAEVNDSAEREKALQSLQAQSQAGKEVLNSETVTKEAQVQNLKTALIQKLKKTRAMLAATLEKSKEWILEEEELIIQFRAQYEAELVRSETLQLLPLIHAIAGKSLRLVVRSDAPIKKEEPQVQSEDGEESEEAEETTAEIVTNMFRGQVIKEVKIDGGQ